VGTVTTQPSGTVAAGNVISESPAAGTSVSAGSAVNLVVSSGPAPGPQTIQCTGCYMLVGGLRATLAFNIAGIGSASRFTYNYRNGAQVIQFASTTTTSIAAAGTTAVFSGQGTLNGQSGYGFTVTATDGGAAGSGLDSASITITGPGSYSYTASGAIAGGDIVVR